MNFYDHFMIENSTVV